MICVEFQKENVDNKKGLCASGYFIVRGVEQ